MTKKTEERVYREHLGITQKEFSFIINAHIWHVQNWELGKYSSISSYSWKKAAILDKVQAHANKPLYKILDMIDLINKEELPLDQSTIDMFNGIIPDSVKKARKQLLEGQF